MFALTEMDLQHRILDCAAGPSSFSAEMLQLNHQVIATDPIYEFSPDEIRSRVAAVRDDMIHQVRAQPSQFVWDYIRSPEHLEESRMTAMEKFLQDFSTDTSRDRYLPQSLPKLYFPDAHFNLALCSHFLFLYSDRLDESFHLASIKELLRIAPEVRIFPVTTLSGQTSPHLPAILNKFPGQLTKVPYEFLKGANQMLILRR